MTALDTAVLNSMPGILAALSSSALLGQVLKKISAQQCYRQDTPADCDEFVVSSAWERFQALVIPS